MSQIETTAVFPNIAPGNVEEFKQIAARVLEKTIPEPAFCDAFSTARRFTLWDTPCARDVPNPDGVGRAANA